MEVKEEFGSAPGEEEAAGQTECMFLLSFFLFFFVCVVGGGKERGGPARTSRKPGLLGDY